MATLVQGQVAAGSHRIQWDGTNTQGKQLPNGVYYLRLQTSQHVSQYRVILAK
jgi:flagellar hook assembly protein FlgD